MTTNDTDLINDSRVNKWVTNTNVTIINNLISIIDRNEMADWILV